jgi:hypothetical protein
MERILIAMPYWLTDRVLFGSHRAAQPLQILVQQIAGGPRPAGFLLDGHTFHYQADHKYFLRGKIMSVTLCRSGRRALTRHVPVMCEIHNAERDRVFELLKNANYTIRLFISDGNFPFRILATVSGLSKRTCSDWFLT